MDRLLVRAAVGGLPLELRQVIDEQLKDKAAASQRVIDVLFYFAEHQPMASVKEISLSLELPVPTVHRYVAMLRRQGILARNGRGQYRVTAVVESLSRAARAGNNVIQIAEPFMRELVGVIDESAVLAQLIDGDAICVHRVEASRRIRLNTETGMRLPPLSGATSKVLLGALPAAARETHLDRLFRMRPELARLRKTFLKEMMQAASDGWATSLQEIDEGVWAMAALIVNGHDNAALTVPCPTFRLDDRVQARITEEVRRTARRISDALARAHIRRA